MKEEKELRIKGGDKILAMIKSFSATEKMLFGLLVIILLICSLILVTKANRLFLTPVPTQGGSLTEGVIGLPHLINPVLASTDTDRDLSTLIYSGLMKNKNGVLVPDLASSYTVSPDNLTYTFILKGDLHFQDGSPITTSDIEFTIGKIQDIALKSPLRADWANVTVKTLSPNQIQFILKQPYAPFLANTTVGILPKHIWSSVSTDEFIFSEYNIEPIGAGPYKLESIERNGGGIPTSYTLVPWTDYVNGEAYIAKIIIRFYSDEKTAIEAYNTKTIESLSSISPANAADIASSSPNAHIIFSPLPRIFGVFFNQNQSAILADNAVRQALNISVDRNEIVRKVLVGFGTPINSALPVGIIPTLGTNNTNTSDIAAAKAILEKDGWKLNPNGLYEKKGKLSTTTLSFSISTLDSPDLTATAQILKNQWALIGVQVNIKVFEAGDFNQNIIRNRSYDALLFGESVGNGLDLYAFWHSSQRNAPGLNIAQYVNSKADALLQDARTTSNAKQKTSDYIDFEKIIETDNPAVFLYSPEFLYILPNKIKGVSISQLTLPSNRWNDISKWYIDTDSIWKFFIQAKK